MGRTNKEDKELYSNLIVYHETKKKGKNMWILFEKIYKTYLGGTTQICFVQFLKQDPHIFAYKYSVYKCNETE